MKTSNRVGPAHTQAGFTLVEVMVASLLLLVVLLPMLAMFTASVSVAVKSETENTAALLAQEQIEEIRALNYESMTLNASQIDAQSGILGTAPADYTFAYQDPPTYKVVARPGGAITPVSTNVQRRKAVYTVKRYILWVDDPMGGSTEDYKKIVVVVSWTIPHPGSMTFEANAVKAGNSTSRPPVVIATIPYIGDAFQSSDEIGTATATATDPDGTPQEVQFQYKKNADATFVNVGQDLSGSLNTSDGYDFSVPWNTTLGSEAQYNLRVIATDDMGLTGTETHPFFIDNTAPLPPGSIAVTDTGGVSYTSLVPTPWPLRVTWPAVYDYIDSNTNFNMVIGYLVYRDERPAGSSDDTKSSTPVAALYGSEVTVFDDATPMLADTAAVRYRLRSMGRAQYWRAAGLTSVPERDSGWVLVGPRTPAHTFSSFTVVALPASWSAVSLTWPPQPAANLYLVYRTPAWDDWPPLEVPPSRSLVGTVPDPGTLTEIGYRDENLTRNTQYQYFVVPVATAAVPGTVEGTSNPVTTRLY